MPVTNLVGRRSTFPKQQRSRTGAMGGGANDKCAAGGRCGRILGVGANVITLGPPESRGGCMRERIGDFIGDESGQDLIEYALAAALIGLTSVAAMSATASNINAVFSAVGSEFSVAVGG